MSICIGKSKVARFKAPGFFQRALLLDLIKVLTAMATDLEETASKMEFRFRNYPSLYHRLNVKRGLKGVSLKEWEKLGDVKTYTIAYLRAENVSRSIDLIVDALLAKLGQSLL